MYRTATVALLVLASALPASAGDLSTGEKITLGLVYPYALHQLPFTTIHEGTHWLTARALGDPDATIHLLPSFIRTPDGGKSLAIGYVDVSRELSPARDAIVSIAPYAMQLLVVDRAIEAGYRSGRVPPDSFGDKYLQTAMLVGLDAPLWNSLRKNGDLARFARHIRVPRILVGAAMQTAYVVSYNRIQKARGHEDSRWIFYIHVTKSF